MRELNECKAEVFRRSDNRINERKRSRNRILALCLPFCLVLTILSVTTLPAIMPAEIVDKSAGEESLGEVTDVVNNNKSEANVSDVNSKEGNYISVTVSGNGSDRTITDVSAAENVFCQIHDILEADEGYMNSSLNNNFMVNIFESLVPDSNEQYKPENIEQYTITLMSSDCSERVFELYGPVLDDVESEKKIILTKKQLNKLMTALGLLN